MNGTVNTLNALGGQFASTALAVLLQSSVIILLVWMADLAIRHRVKAQVRYLLWLCVLVKVTLPVNWVVPFSLAERVSRLPPPVETSPLPVTTVITVWQGDGVTLPLMEQPPLDPPATVEKPFAVPPGVSLTTQGAVCLLWITGVCLLSLYALFRRLKVHGQCRRAIDIYPGVKQTTSMETPCVIGLFKPVILIPGALAKGLSPEELDLILRHERMHIRRGDLWVQAWQTLLQILFFFHPLLWVANRHITHLREMAVDEAMARSEEISVSAYCRLLIQVVARTQSRHILPAHPGMAGLPSKLHRRVSRLLTGYPSSSTWSRLVLMALLPAAYLLLPGGVAKNQDANLSRKVDPVNTTPEATKETTPSEKEKLIEGATPPAVVEPSPPALTPNKLSTLKESDLEDEPAMAKDPSPDIEEPVRPMTHEGFPLQIQINLSYLTVPSDQLDSALELIERLTDSNKAFSHQDPLLRKLDVDLMWAPYAITTHGNTMRFNSTHEFNFPQRYSIQKDTASTRLPADMISRDAGLKALLSPRVVWDGNPKNMTLSDYAACPIQLHILSEYSYPLEQRQFDGTPLEFPDRITAEEFSVQDIKRVVEFKHGQTKIVTTFQMKPYPPSKLPGSSIVPTYHTEDRSIIVLASAGYIHPLITKIASK